MTKSSGPVFFYIFLIIFVILAYLYNNDKLTFIPKKVVLTEAEKNLKMFKDKRFFEDITRKYENSAVEIASFEEGEKWQGNYEYDSTNYLEGKTGFLVVSKKNQANALEIPINLNLQNMNVFKILVYSASAENGNNINSFTIQFETDNNVLEYDIANIAPGWNLVKMPKNNFISNENPVSGGVSWSSVKKVKINLTSRPNTQTELTLDRLWGERDETYQELFSTNSPNMISLKEFKGKTYMNYWGLNGSNSQIKKIASATNFTHTAKIIPQKEGAFGLSAHLDLAAGSGYFFELGGVGLSGWELYKLGLSRKNNDPVELKSGEFPNGYRIRENKPLWIGVSMKNGVISCFYSLDGKTFNKLTEHYDGEIRSGSVGFVNKEGSFLLESVDFTQ